MPRRIQLQRTKGWRKPESAIVVARPSAWGNPFRVGGTCPLIPPGVLVRDRAHAVGLFRIWIYAVIDSGREIQTFGGPIAFLTGHDLACWCPLDQPCHADVLLEIANNPLELP